MFKGQGKGNSQNGGLVLEVGGMKENQVSLDINRPSFIYGSLST